MLRNFLLLSLSLYVFLAGDLVAEEACLMCHRGQTESFAHRTHDVSCAACHGASETHLKNPMKQPPDNTFGPEGTGESCLSCHEGSAMIFWQGSEHEMAGTACHDCHEQHTSPAASSETKAGSQCLSCHQSLKSSEHLPSRHPVAEGQMSCSDCHAPHGSANESLLHGDLPTDLCTSCHSEFRGPFLYEHDPVTEDCGLCHKPHGSVQRDMLVARPPFLCQQCHQAANHPSALNDRSALLSGSSGSSGSSNLMAGSCLNCHGRIHGSNHPGGARLTR